jgi:hypothetical protein
MNETEQLATDVGSRKIEPTPLEALQIEKLRLEIGDLSEKGLKHPSALLPWLTALVALAALLLQIITTRQTSRENFQKEFWSRQLAQYETAVDLASKLSTEEEGAARDNDFRAFTELYYGKLVIYEDVAVQKAMVKFRELYLDYRHNPGMQLDVQHAARDLASECRKSAAKTWGQQYVPVEPQ